MPEEGFQNLRINIGDDHFSEEMRASFEEYMVNIGRQMMLHGSALRPVRESDRHIPVRTPYAHSNTIARQESAIDVERLQADMRRMAEAIPPRILVTPRREQILNRALETFTIHGRPNHDIAIGDNITVGNQDCMVISISDSEFRVATIGPLPPPVSFDPSALLRPMGESPVATARGMIAEQRAAAIEAVREEQLDINTSLRTLALEPDLTEEQFHDLLALSSYAYELQPDVTLQDVLTAFAREGFADAHYHRTGSQEICNPAPQGRDEDWLIYIHENADPERQQRRIQAAVRILFDFGFDQEGGEHYQIGVDTHFHSFRKGKLNILLTANEQFCQRHQRATAFCKKLNVMDKEDRIALFRCFLYEETLV